MARIIDYVNWRGDLSFEQDPFNPVDAAIFSQLSVLDFDDIVPSSGSGNTLENIFELYLGKGYKIEDPVGFLISNKQHKLFEAVAHAQRYKNLKISNYQRNYDKDNPCQFEAMSIDLGNTLLISFGGTDDTIAGWHEDFQLLYLEEIPAHKHGYKYLADICKNIAPEKDIVLCGHSKGANIAMEVLLNASEEVFDRVSKVYCFDGPGINQKQYEEALLRGRIDKIVSYVPYRTSVGKLFNHYEEFKIIECTANLLFQHDLLTWHIYRNDFIYKENVSADSVYLDTHLKKIINDLSIEQRKDFVNAFFKLLYSCGENTLTDVYKHRSKLVSKFFKLTKKERELLNSVLIKRVMGDHRMRKMVFALIREFRNRD